MTKQGRTVSEVLDFYSIPSDGGCTRWIGPTQRDGYGLANYWEGDRRVCTTAHRAAWIAKYGPIPRNVYVCHTCDNRQCVNLDHLFLGSQQDNINDMIAKGRHRPRGRIPGQKSADGASAPLARTKAGMGGYVSRHGDVPEGY